MVHATVGIRARSKEGGSARGAGGGRCRGQRLGKALKALARQKPVREVQIDCGSRSARARTVRTSLDSLALGLTSGIVRVSEPDSDEVGGVK
jgi:hypothetical protein